MNKSCVFNKNKIFPMDGGRFLIKSGDLVRGLNMETVFLERVMTFNISVSIVFKIHKTRGYLITTTGENAGGEIYIKKLLQ
jgi:hypothetical protein